MITVEIGPGLRWCTQWWQHPMAIARLESIWRAWEEARISDDPTAMSVWWRDHADPHLDQLMESPRGPFRQCTGQAVAAKKNIRAAMVLLDWLASHDLSLATARQGDLEAWLTSADTTHRADAGNFVRWARRQKLTRLDHAAVRWGGPSGIIDTETRWEQARWLLHDDALKPEDRVAGLLVLLYAQSY